MKAKADRDPATDWEGETPTPEALDNDAYLRLFPTRVLLNDRCRATFDQDALAYRAFVKHNVRPVPHVPVGGFLLRLISLWDDPAFWKSCLNCMGPDGKSTGLVDHLYCRSCMGNGYHLSMRVR